MKTMQPQVTKRTGISDGKIQEGKVYLYFFLEDKHPCINFGSFYLVNKIYRTSCQLYKGMPICRASKIEFMTNKLA